MEPTKSSNRNRLREIRARERVTQFRLALATGSSQTEISYIENGYKIPDQGQRLKIAEALGVPITEIFPDTR